MFAPAVAARQGVELLRRGGSLIVLPDFSGDAVSPILGRSISIAQGPLWLARRTGRPIVPFALIPPRRDRRWRLWCGEPIPATPKALASTLEGCIRRLPTTWAYWRGWHAAPRLTPPHDTAARPRPGVERLAPDCVTDRSARASPYSLPHTTQSSIASGWMGFGGEETTPPG
jgi:hypothetical protein